MDYNKKVKTLLLIIAGLSLIYVASIVFTPEFLGSRSDSYVWLDSRNANRITNIILSEEEGIIELVKRDDQWFVMRNDIEYPARDIRVEDFIQVFTKRGNWPVRATSASSVQRLGLDENSAVRVMFFSGNNTLLDVLFGDEDNTGREIYVRRTGQNEIRSGDNIVFSYIRGSVNNWFNLRLIPETEDGSVAVDSVQRLTVYTQGETQIFSRRNRTWSIMGLENEDLDQTVVDSYVKAIINTEGDDFIDYISANDPSFDHSRIVLELDDSRIKTIRISDADESGSRLAHVDGVNFVYSIAPWASSRLFRNLSDFVRN